MTDNLDDWLTSLNTPTPHTLPDSTIDSSVSSVEIPSQPSQPTQSLSDQDFDDILGDFGFERPQDANAEEISEEENEEWEEVDTTDTPNIEDYNSSTQLTEAMELFRDELSDAPTTPEEAVHFHMPDGNTADVPIVHEDSNEGATQPEEPLLPLNSPTLLLDESTSRFSGAEWYEEIQRQSIIVAGIGGIGSNLAFQLSRMHPASLFMYDDDMVEAVNMSGQLYARNDVGKSKVAAMTDMITAYTNMQNIYAIKDRFASNTEAGSVMMCGFDNMEARRTFFDAWQRHVFALPKEYWSKCLFLDGRLSLDTLQVFCITGDNDYAMTEYRDQYLFSDEEAEHTVCSMKQTTYLACMIGSIMVNLFTNWVANSLNPIIPYDLPFFTEYDAQNMIFKTIK